MTAGYDNTARFAGSGNALHLTIAADAFLGAADSHEWNTADGHATVIVGGVDWLRQ